MYTLTSHRPFQQVSNKRRYTKRLKDKICNAVPVIKRQMIKRITVLSILKIVFFPELFGILLLFSFNVKEHFNSKSRSYLSYSLEKERFKVEKWNLFI